MKTIASILTIAIIPLLFSREPSTEKKTTIVDQGDTIKAVIEKKEQEGLDERQQTEEQKKVDSTRLDDILKEAIKIAEKNKQRDRFKKKYVTAIADSSYQVDVDISSDFYFTPVFPHLIIRRSTPSSVYIDIFSKTNKQFQKVLSHEQLALEYRGDTIRDINGDHLKDFVVNWYGSNGCCLKAFSNIYLLRPDKQAFSNNFEFINPTFSPKQQIIRGVCYGHPGETEMYKYKWNDEAVDTVEYIHYEKNDNGEKTGKLIVSNRLPYSTNYKVLKLLSSIPSEYKKIEGYNWFTGAGY